MDAALGVGGVAPEACRSLFTPQGAEAIQLEAEPNGRVEASQADVEGEVQAGLGSWGEEDTAVVGILWSEVGGHLAVHEREEPFSQATRRTCSFQSVLGSMSPSPTSSRA